MQRSRAPCRRPRSAGYSRTTRCHVCRACVSSRRLRWQRPILQQRVGRLGRARCGVEHLLELGQRLPVVALHVVRLADPVLRVGRQRMLRIRLTDRGSRAPPARARARGRSPARRCTPARPSSARACEAPQRALGGVGAGPPRARAAGCAGASSPRPGPHSGRARPATSCARRFAQPRSASSRPLQLGPRPALDRALSRAPSPAAGGSTPARAAAAPAARATGARARSAARDAAFADGAGASADEDRQ